MMRLDKYISNAGYSRKEACDNIKNGNVVVNGNVIRQKEYKVDENVDEIIYFGKKLSYNKHIYIMLNKPDGVLSATTDINQKTVIDILPREIQNQKVFPVGRLDKHTLGLLLITNDGEFCHCMINPKKCVNKKYKFCLANAISMNEVRQIEEGILLKDGYKTLPCIINLINDKSGIITISEGKYHQVRRMFGAVGNKIVYLKRISEGNIKLDENLDAGQWRFLTQDEVKNAFNK